MVDAICTELVLKKHRLEGQQIGSIYFGGGTPSVLSLSALQQIFDTLTQHYSIASNAEITLETNPDDLHAQKIKDLKSLPVNRFSIGTQSFFNEDLVWMNRAHNAEEATTCIKRSQDAGFENLTIDLIYGYPLLSDEKWLSNIQTAVDLQIPHMSAYSLTVEPKTALANAIKKGIQKQVNDDQSASQFTTLINTITNAGFEHYEISNYSLPGKYAIHNTNYWKGIPYLGIGPSAHGFDGNVRYINVANNAKYMSDIANKTLPETIEELSKADKYNEYVMTALRTMWGLDLQKVENDFGKQAVQLIQKEIKPHLASNKVEITDNKIILKPGGKLFADGIAADLFADEEEL